MSENNQQVIADRLGLSRATVSRCFTNHSGISPVTRAKVFEVAAEIGYTHMSNRTSLKKEPEKKPRFSVLICSDKEEYFRGRYESPGEQILAGVSEYAQANKIQMEVHFVSPSVVSLEDPVFKELASLKKRKGVGVLLIYPFPAPVLEELALKFPMVSLVDQVEHNTIDCVDVDHYAGISSAIKYLVEKGHERIGFYTKDYEVKAGWSLRRYGAFVEKMARLSLRVSDRDIVGVFPHQFSSFEERLDVVAERTNDGVTAWVCAADHQAYDLIRGLKERGLETPRDVSVTGFDGIGGQGDEPELTTIEIPFRAIGVTGAERLAARMRQRFRGKQHAYISGKLREGKTVAARD